MQLNYYFIFSDECENFLANLEVYKQICQVRTDISDSIRSTILIDTQFPKKVQDEINLQIPVCEIIRVAEQKTCTLANIISMWLNLKSKIPKCSKSIIECVDSRTNDAITPLGLAAFYIDPRSDKTILSSAQRGQVNKFFSKFFGNTELNDFVDFGQKAGKFRDYFQQNLSSKVFWNMLLPETENVATLALKLTAIPASNSQIERIFHSWSTIHTKLRNRLTAERSKKLVHIYYSLVNREKPKVDNDENDRPINDVEVVDVDDEDVEDGDIEDLNSLDDMTDISDEELDDLLEVVRSRRN